MITEDLKIVLNYQEALKREKCLLLKMELPRACLRDGLKDIIQECKLRSVKREIIVQMIGTLTGPSSTRDELILNLPLSLDLWCSARSIAEKVIGKEKEEWWAMRQEAIDLQNVVIHRYARVIDKIIARHFAHASNLWPDLEGEGLIGMIRGLETLNPKKGNNVEAHLQAWALSHMLNYLKESDDRKCREVYLALTREEKGSPVPVGVPSERKRHFGAALTYRNWSNEGETALLSINAAIDGRFDQDGLTWCDTIPIEEARAPFENADRSLALERLYEAAQNRPGFVRLSLGMTPPGTPYAEGESFSMERALDELQKLAVSVVESLAQ